MLLLPGKEKAVKSCKVGRVVPDPAVCEVSGLPFRIASARININDPIELNYEIYKENPRCQLAVRTADCGGICARPWSKFWNYCR